MKKDGIFVHKSHQSPIIVSFAENIIGRDIFSDMSLTLQTTVNIYQDYLRENGRWMKKMQVYTEPIACLYKTSLNLPKQIKEFSENIKEFHGNP